MDNICTKFIESIVDISPNIDTVCERVKNYWLPNLPPITVIFGEIGDHVAQEFDICDSEKNKRIFDLIERAMASKDTKLVTAVATGLIEAIVTTTDKNDGLWQRILAVMGPMTRRHAEWWRAF